MKKRKHSAKLMVALLMVGIVFMNFLGCAGSKVTERQSYVGDERLARPSGFYVYNFATGRDDVITDTFGAEFETDAETLSDEETKRRAIAALLTSKVVEDMRRRGIYAYAATPSKPPPVTAIILKGQFVTIEEGKRGKRVLIGFGAGSDEVLVRAQVYQVMEDGLRRIAEGEAEAHGSKKPGMLFPIAGAVATGRAAGAVIAGGLTMKTEASDKIDADIGRLAKTIAEQAEDFYRRQGWL